MHEKARRAILFLSVCVLVFWVSFRAGEIYSRMKAKTEVRIIEMPQEIYRKYFIVRKYPNGETGLEYVDQSHVYIRFFRNKNIRRFLKKLNIRIYTIRGIRIY